MTRREALGSQVTTVCQADFHKGSCVILHSQDPQSLLQIQATMLLSWTVVVASCLDPQASVSS